MSSLKEVNEKLDKVLQKLARHDEKFLTIDDFKSQQNRININLYEKMSESSENQIRIDELAKSNKQLTWWLIGGISGLLTMLVLTLIGHWLMFSYNKQEVIDNRIYEILKESKTKELKK